MDLTNPIGWYSSVETLEKYGAYAMSHSCKNVLSPTKSRAFAHLERLCGPMASFARIAAPSISAGKLNGVKGKNGKRPAGLWKCYSKECRKQFTVTGRHRVRGMPTFRCTRCCRRSTCCLLIQEGHFSAHQLHRILGGRLQVGVVPGTPHSRSDAGRHACPDGRRAARLWRSTKPTSAAWRAHERRSGTAPQEHRSDAGRARRFGAQLPCRRHHACRRRADRPRRTSAAKADLMTDEAHALRAARQGVRQARHASNHSNDEYVRGDDHTPTRSRASIRSSSAA